MSKATVSHPNNDAVELLKTALAAGHSVVLSLAAPPHVDRVPPLVTTCCLLFDLTESEARTFVELIEHGPYVSREALHRAMSRSGKVSNIKTLSVVVCRVREKMSPFGVGIENLWGQGYRLEAESRDRLRTLIAAYGEDVVAAATQMKTKPV